VGEIISEWRATSNRSGGRDHSGMVGDIERNQHRGISRYMCRWCIDLDVKRR
jgi:hypothetical protein